MLKLFANLNKNQFFLKKILTFERYFSKNGEKIALTIEEQSKILNKLNNSSENELIHFGLSKNRTDQIISWRNKNGYFQDLDQMIQISGFGKKIVDKIANTILNPQTEKKEITKKPKQGRGTHYTIPHLPEITRSKIQSCLSFQIGIANIGWSRFEVQPKLTPQCTLTHWEFENLIDKKLHINELIQECMRLINVIPKSDCYILENPKVAQISQPGSPAQVNINIQKSQVISVLSYALLERKFMDLENNERPKIDPNLFYLKKYLYSRLFNTLVGTETISSFNVIAKLIEEKTSFLLSSELEEKYCRFDKIQREFVGQSALIGLAFTKLCLLKDPYSITKISRNSSAPIEKE